MVEDSYYEKAVIWAANNGIVKGYDAETYGPEDNITREQLSAILFRYANYKNCDTSARADLSGYTDQERISGYAVECMEWANANGIITGATETTLVPRGDATRAQVAAVLHRFCVMFNV